MKNHLFCFGLGYVARSLADIVEDSYKISGTHTGKKSFEKDEYLFDSNFDLKLLDDVTHILLSIPPTDAGDIIYLQLIDYLKGLKHLRWVGYLSSTSVYGDHNGDWVTEESRVDEINSLGRNRLIAEEQWLNSGLPVNVFRLAGIYGQNRSVFDSIKLNKAIRVLKDNHYFSRIYIKDLVNIIKLVMNNPKLGEIYNVADDMPSPQHEVVEFAYNLINQTPPQLIHFKDAILSDVMKNYYNSSKRVDNKKLKRDYNIRLEFPSYKDGLNDILKSRS